MLAPGVVLLAVIGVWLTHTVEHLRVGTAAGVSAAAFSSVHVYMLPVGALLALAAALAGVGVWRAWWALGRRLEQTGILHKGVDIPFKIVSDVSLTSDGRIRLHPVDTKIFCVDGDRLMKALGLTMQKMVDVSKASTLSRRTSRRWSGAVSPPGSAPSPGSIYRSSPSTCSWPGRSPGPCSWCSEASASARAGWWRASACSSPCSAGSAAPTRSPERRAPAIPRHGSSSAAASGAAHPRSSSRPDRRPAAGPRPTDA